MGPYLKPVVSRDPRSVAAAELLFAMHNALMAQSLAAEKCPPAERVEVCAGAAKVLKQKMKTLRRMRLPMLYDDLCWALPQGGLNHLLVTIPFWLRSPPPRPVPFPLLYTCREHTARMTSDDQCCTHSCATHSSHTAG